MSEQQRISIIILNWNTFQTTLKCLDTINKHLTLPKEIILVDNGSNDGSEEYFRNYQATDYKFIGLKKNVGFAAGNNIGIKQATGDFILLLNSDAFITANSIETMLKEMLANGADLIGPMTNKAKGPQAKRSFLRLFYRYFGRCVETKYLSFFCIMIQVKVFKEIGLLDENFGIGTFEDDDFCKRADRSGFKMMIAEKAWVWHDSHTTMKANNLRDDELILINEKIFKSKWKE